MNPTVNPGLVHTDVSMPHKFADFVCWKSIAAGVLGTLLSYMLMSSLGAGVAGLTASHIIEKGGSESGVATGAGLWLGASAVISLFLGSYFATRFSDATHKQVGACRAIIISAIFFYFLINVASSSMGSFADVAANLSHSFAVSEADEAAKSVAAAGWLIFVTLFFGIIAAVVGGIEGVTGNVKRPFRVAA